MALLMWLRRNWTAYQRSPVHNVEVNVRCRPSEPSRASSREGRIRVALGVETWMPLPRVDEESLRQYGQHLNDCLTFPFTAEYFDEYEGEACDNLVTAVRLIQPCQSAGHARRPIECEVIVFGQPVTVRLSELRPIGAPDNRQTLDDYRYWLGNCH